MLNSKEKEEEEVMQGSKQMGLRREKKGFERNCVGYFGEMTVPQLMQKRENLILYAISSAMRCFLIQSKPHSSVSSATLHSSIVPVCID